MPTDLPAQNSLDALLRAVPKTSADVSRTLTDLIDAGRANLQEIKSVAAQVEEARQKLAAAEKNASALQAATDQWQKQFEVKTAEALRLDSELKVAHAQLAASASQIADLLKAVADLQEKTKTTGTSGSRTVVDLVGELRNDVAHLLGAPFRAPNAPGAPGVIVDNLEFEIRGDLAMGDKVGLKTFAPDRAGPEGASVLRFSIKPEMRVEVPDEEKK